MDENSINQSLKAYEEQVRCCSTNDIDYSLYDLFKIYIIKFQLEQVELALENEQDDADKNNLLSLKRDLIQLIDLTKENLNELKSHTGDNMQNGSNLDTEFALFMVSKN